MAWNDSLLNDQEEAASHVGTHARLLAGPGTGKTLVITRRVLYLIQVVGIDPKNILVLTFTRAACQELKKRIHDELIDSEQPCIFTLHSFALRQLLHNSQRLINLPQPLRIADDWEERNIIQEDLKSILHLERIDQVQELFYQLSSDWQSLTFDQGTMRQNAQFIGAWEGHRKVFGYTLRNELVYQFKRSLEQINDFKIEIPIEKLIIDEYQDLNQCDLAVVRLLINNGIELFVAGDDDQSIYGFRKAHPEGIRRFNEDYLDSTDLHIEVCMRCDRDILELAEYVAQLDYRRIPKVIRSADDKGSGEVKILRFENQYFEAVGIARLCRQLINCEGILPKDILILTRVNTQNAFSNCIKNVFDNFGIPFSCNVSSQVPLGDSVGREILSFLRLINNIDDHLAWRSLLKVRRNNIGDIIIGSIRDIALDQGFIFSELLDSINNDNSIIPRFGRRISEEYNRILEIVNLISSSFNFENITKLELENALNELVQCISNNDGNIDNVKELILSKFGENDSLKLFDLLRNIESSNESIEQELNPDCVNMLTMHKAKGLTSEVVIIIAAEDEYIPGRYMNEPELGDERRLLYVSLSRAKHKLFVTYCNNRIDQQQRLGRTSGNSRRNITQFLRNAYLHPIDGDQFINNRCE